jgi:hypothetical protein
MQTDAAKPTDIRETMIGGLSSSTGLVIGARQIYKTQGFHKYYNLVSFKRIDGLQGGKLS